MGASVSIHWDKDYGGKCIDLTNQTILNFKSQKWNDDITSIAIPSQCSSSDWDDWNWDTEGGGETLILTTRVNYRVMIINFLI